MGARRGEGRRPDVVGRREENGAGWGGETVGMGRGQPANPK